MLLLNYLLINNVCCWYPKLLSNVRICVQNPSSMNEPLLNVLLKHFVTLKLETASFQKRSPEWRFLKTLASRLRVDGRKPRFSNTMMPKSINHISLITSITHALWGMLSYFHCLAFSFGRAIRVRYVWMRIFLKTGEKNLRFQKYPETCGRGFRLDRA